MGSRGLMCAREIVATAALRGIMSQQDNLQRSYSMNDVSDRKIITKSKLITHEIHEEENAEEEDSSHVRTWSGEYNDHGHIVEHTVSFLVKKSYKIVNQVSEFQSIIILEQVFNIIVIYIRRFFEL